MNGPTRALAAGALAVLAARPAAGPALAFLQLFPGPPNAALPGGLLLGILDPADELVAGQRRDVIPGIECRAVGDQRHTKVCGQFMHHPTGHSLGAHRPMVVGRGRPASPSALVLGAGECGPITSGRRSTSWAGAGAWPAVV